MRPMKFGIGQPHVRVEDPALITGRGRFLADCIPAGALRAVVVRSPHAHARFRIRNLDAVRGRAGVRLVLAAADIAGYGTMPCGGLITPSDEKRMWRPPLPLLAQDEVRHVGDAVAFVVADTLAAAQDAAEAFEIDWETLPAIVDTKAATAPGAPLVWSERPGNLSYTAEFGDAAAAARAFEAADRVVKIELVNQRLVTNYMETRGALAEPAADSGPLTLTVSTQGSHAIRDALCDKVLKIAREELRVVTPDVGGGFGTKLGPYREYALAVIAAKKLERAVAWVADRSEHFIGDSQGRDNVSVAEMALGPRGRFLAMRVDTIANLGAYLSYYAPFIPWNGASMLSGSYAIPALHARVRAVYTHTVPVDAYRGAGRPEATYVIERLVDAVAREIGATPEEVRRLNFIPPEAMPYKTATGRSYDSGEFAGHLDRAQELAEWNGFTARAKDSERRGQLRGIGLCSYIEACGGGSEEVARLRLERDGSATLLIGTQSNGQGHKTAYAQIIAGELDLPLDQIRVVQGDTARIATGGGTGGSRSLPTGGVSVQGAARKLAVNLKNLAAAELDARPDELEITAGSVRVPGTNRAISLAALAARPDAAEHAVAEDTYAPSTGTYPNGTHICEVEIDPATGRVSIERYTVVDDFGATINPLLLEGQVQGGVAQGIGQALLERTVYDETGQLVTASLMDYALPRADDLPFFKFETRNVPCKTNPLGLKGAGEAGAIGSCPAVMNAVVDALDRGFGIRHLDMPATPERVWGAIERAKRSRRM